MSCISYESTKLISKFKYLKKWFLLIKAIRNAKQCAFVDYEIKQF